MPLVRSVPFRSAPSDAGDIPGGGRSTTRGRAAVRGRSGQAGTREPRPLPSRGRQSGRAQRGSVSATGQRSKPPGESISRTGCFTITWRSVPYPSPVGPPPPDYAELQPASDCSAARRRRTRTTPGGPSWGHLLRQHRCPPRRHDTASTSTSKSNVRGARAEGTRGCEILRRNSVTAAIRRSSETCGRWKTARRLQPAGPCRAECRVCHRPQFAETVHCRCMASDPAPIATPDGYATAPPSRVELPPALPALVSTREAASPQTGSQRAVGRRSLSKVRPHRITP